MQSHSLDGFTVVVTRATHQSTEFIEALCERGAEVISAPAIELVTNTNSETYEDSLIALYSGRVSRILLGSVNAAVALQRILSEDVRYTLGCAHARFAVACVGEKTANYIRNSDELSQFFDVFEVADEAHSEGLADKLLSQYQTIEEHCFFYPGAQERRPVLEDVLCTQGAQVLRADLYRIQTATTYTEQTHSSLAQADIFTFFSGRTIQCFLEAAGEQAGRRYLDSAVVATIGPVAAQQAREMGIRVDVTPEVASTESLIEVLCKQIKRPT